MPEAAEFLKGFNFIQGKMFAEFTLISTYSTHETIKRYQEYKYNITLTFKGTGNYDNLYQAVMNEVNQQHIIYGVRNPYLCKVDPPKEGDIIVNDNCITDRECSYIFNLLGHSYRQH